MYDLRQYVIFDITELPSIDFTQVLETSTETVRISVDGTKTFVKWDGETPPSCLENLTTKSQYYTHEEILSIISTSEWTNSQENP